MINAIEINNEDIKTIVEIFEKEDLQNISARINKNYISTRVYLDSEEESHLYMYIFKNEIVIQSIFVTNQRQSIGSKLIKQCALLGRNKGANRIRIQSVLTDEMVSLCKKFNFKQDEYARLLSDKGDYTASISTVLNKNSLKEVG